MLASGPHGEVLVPVEIDGVPLVFQLDTGASASLITPATRARLQLAAGSDVSDAIGAGGAIAGAIAVTLPRLRVAGRELRELAVDVAPLGESDAAVAGVLGLDVLGRYIADIDLPAHRLALLGRDATAWQSRATIAVPYRVDEGLVVFDARVDRVAVTAILDLGASATIASSQVWTGDAAPSGASAHAIGADGQPIEVRSHAGATVELGALSVAAQSLIVGDLPVFDALHLSNRPALILGIDLLAAHRIVIDPIARRVYFSPG